MVCIKWSRYRHCCALLRSSSPTLPCSCLWWNLNHSCPYYSANTRIIIYCVLFNYHLSLSPELLIHVYRLSIAPYPCPHPPPPPPPSPPKKNTEPKTFQKWKDIQRWNPHKVTKLGRNERHHSTFTDSHPYIF